MNNILYIMEIFKIEKTKRWEMVFCYQYCSDHEPLLLDRIVLLSVIKTFDNCVILRQIYRLVEY